ncbi:hypothetical protein [Methylobacterium sp. J-077]|uniref:hypothetical protein n=1 Tax=Methylobacterium sp. J-077 TaxID=2836656 RepID=UPI001FBACAA0|nr:hypothetical protein [Methylobacterium sp. J-077]MCJ2121247.1 hypothetical protein [Methylobacterium sp. J-077]
MLLRVATLALGLSAMPALGQPAAKAPARPGQDRAAHDKTGPDRKGAGQVIGCPSLANYRMLLHDGAAAAASVLADPKADHLGCTLVTRSDITGLVDRVTLGDRSYECAALPTTTVCHWMEAGAAARPAPAAAAKR